MGKLDEGFFYFELDANPPKLKTDYNSLNKTHRNVTQI
jgi:hypothetical protein